jgi:Cu/Ag efflux pump CusA
VENIPLSEVVELTESDGPTAIRRENGTRAIASS